MFSLRTFSTQGAHSMTPDVQKLRAVRDDLVAIVDRQVEMFCGDREALFSDGGWVGMSVQKMDEWRQALDAALAELGDPPVAEQEKEPTKAQVDCGFCLCSQCQGNGVLKIPGGVTVCKRCNGRCWEPSSPPASASSVLVEGEGEEQGHKGTRVVGRN
jgi:hypothetical protein